VLRIVSTAVLLSIAGSSTAAEKHLSFVSCPIVRDTKTVPCWLAEYEGETYFLTIQTDVSAPVNPPWLGHRVLVEGMLSDEPSICGGRVLKPVKLSVLPELDASCNTILPAEDRYELDFEPPRPPGPSGGRLAFSYEAPPRAKPGDGPKDFAITYDFDGMVVFRHPRTLEAILDYARDTQAKHIEIVGYRGASLLSNGKQLVEAAGIGERRAKQVAELLQGAGLTDIEYIVRWQDKPAKPNGRTDPTNRKVDVTVKP
jgi:outer membrane protein OmpA-like peptidoglycan-associated protein